MFASISPDFDNWLIDAFVKQGLTLPVNHQLPGRAQAAALADRLRRVAAASAR
jgi:hypothetical protein